MIDNPNYNPEKLAEHRELDRQSRYEKGNQRKLVDARIRVQNDPSYLVVPDEVDKEE